MSQRPKMVYQNHILWLKKFKFGTVWRIKFLQYPTKVVYLSWNHQDMCKIILPQIYVYCT